MEAQATLYLIRELNSLTREQIIHVANLIEATEKKVSQNKLKEYIKLAKQS